MNDDHFSGKYWYHLNCFTLEPRFKEIDPETQVYKIQELEKGDYEEVVKHIKEEVERLNDGKKKGKVAKAKAKKKAKKDQNEEEEQDVKKVEKKTQVVPKSKSKNKRSASSTKKTKKPKKKAVKSGYTAAQQS